MKSKDPIFSEEELKEDFSEEQMKNKGLEISNHWLYKIFIKSAYRIINKPLAILTILKRALKELKKYDSVKEFSADAKEQIETIVRLLRAFAKKEYEGISTLNAVLSIAALLYFISPVDFIPDVLAIGFLDDIALLTWLYKNIRHEIDAFLEWEDSQKIKLHLDIK